MEWTFQLRSYRAKMQPPTPLHEMRVQTIDTLNRYKTEVLRVFAVRATHSVIPSPVPPLFAGEWG
jgi:hypothetical protein